MNTLDSVYNAFKNLDRDFAKSKKSRSEFIVDKFGGDIEIGSLIILDAISSSTGEESPEDIEKLTFIKDIFDKIKSNQNNLDSLSDFSFTDNSEFANLLHIIEESVVAGTHIRHSSQSDIHKLDRGSIHFVVDPSGTVCCPVNNCKVFHIYNEHMDNLLATAFRRDTSVTLGSYAELKNRTRLVQVDESKLSKALK